MWLGTGVASCPSSLDYNITSSPSDSNSNYDAVIRWRDLEQQAEAEFDQDEQVLVIDDSGELENAENSDNEIL